MHKKYTIIIIVIILIFSFPNNSYAKDECIANQISNYSTCHGLSKNECDSNSLCTWKTESKTTDTTQTVTLPNPLGAKASINPNEIIGQIINAVLGLVGSIALIMFIYGGFVWMTAAGNKEAVSKGKNIITWAVIGIVVIFMSYAAVNFLLTRAIQPAPTQNQNPVPAE